MSLTVTCPRCGEVLHLPSNFRGRNVRCEDCRHLFRADADDARPHPDWQDQETPAPERRGEKASPRTGPSGTFILHSPVTWIIGGTVLCMLLICGVGAFGLLLLPWSSGPPKGEVFDPFGEGPFSERQPVGGNIVPPKLEGDIVTRLLPAPVGDMAVGGGGRFLILHLPTLRQFAVFDVNEVRIVKTLPTDADVKFAAGQNHLIVLQPGTRVVQRWNLRTFEKETEAPVRMEVPPVAVAMGSASDGPLVISGVDWPRLGETVFFDVKQMRRIEVAENAHGLFDTSPTMFLRASADGRVFAGDNGSHGLQSCVWSDGAVKMYRGQRGNAPVPGPDGSRIYTTAGALTTELKPAAVEDMACVPADHGPYFLTETRQGAVSIFVAGENNPVLNLAPGEGLNGEGVGSREGLTLDKRIHLLPDAGLLISIPAANDRLVLRRVNLGRGR